MHQKQKLQKKFLDISSSKQQQRIADFRRAIKKAKPTSTLFSNGKRTENFFTEDSKLYITPRQQILLRNGVELDQNLHKWDSLSARVVTKFVRYQPSETSLLLKSLERRYAMLNEATGDIANNFFGQFSTARLWNASIVGSILFGMVMMTFVYKYLGQGAAAKQLAEPVQGVQQQISSQPTVLGAADTKADAESFAKQFKEIEQINDRQLLEKEIGEMVKGYPIEDQVQYIAKQDRMVAIFYVAIAKKESAWGKRVPLRDGKDCYNYVGYRGIREKMGTGGHTCFDSPQDAVKTVSARIKTLVEVQGMTTPTKMVNIWKCGSKSNCGAVGGEAAADKWAVDVNSIFEKFSKKEKK